MKRAKTGTGAVLAAIVIAAAGVFTSCQKAGNNPGSTPDASQYAPNVRSLGVAPNIVLPTLQGPVFDLSEHRGEVVVVNFWATWCAPCLEEIPEFVALQKEYGPGGLRFIGVSVDDEGVGVVRDFAERLSINYPIAMDDGEVAAAYKGNAVIPSTFVIDRSGMIRSRYIGVVTFDTLVPEIEALLAEDAAT